MEPRVNQASKCQLRILHTTSEVCHHMSCEVIIEDLLVPNHRTCRNPSLLRKIKVLHDVD